MCYCKFLTKSSGKRILKIDQHLAKLLTKNVVGLFYDSQCTEKIPANTSSHSSDMKQKTAVEILGLLTTCVSSRNYIFATELPVLYHRPLCNAAAYE